MGYMGAAGIKHTKSQIPFILHLQFCRPAAVHSVHPATHRAQVCSRWGDLQDTLPGCDTLQNVLTVSRHPLPSHIQICCGHIWLLRTTKCGESCGCANRVARQANEKRACCSNCSCQLLLINQRLTTLGAMNCRKWLLNNSSGAFADAFVSI
jgi:hypothetical protein